MPPALRQTLLGIPVSIGVSLADVLARLETALTRGAPLAISFVNPACFVLAADNATYRTALAALDMVLPDGIGAVLAIRALTGVATPRLSMDATSLYHPLATALQNRRATVAICGGAPGVAEKFVARLRADYPALAIVAVLDGYQPAEKLLSQLVAARPQAVWLGMGAPRQEALAVQLRDAGVPVVVTCGGFLDQYAAGGDYYPRWVDRLQLRWAWRLWREPQRLWRRYLLQYPRFGVMLAAAFCQQWMRRG